MFESVQQNYFQIYIKFLNNQNTEYSHRKNTDVEKNEKENIPFVDCGSLDVHSGNWHFARIADDDYRNDYDADIPKAGNSLGVRH